MSERADVVVLGMGPGGEEVAGRLAEAGLDVVGIEGKLVGGECPYWGCIPSKIMVRSANLLAEARRFPGMVGSAEVSVDYAQVVARVRDATDSWDDRVAAERFEGKGGWLVRGWGRLAGPGRVIVGDREIEAGRAVVVATGTAASIPPIPGLADVPYWTNREIIESDALPESLVVIGGGAIGCELAQAFARFGSEVGVVEVAPRLLPQEEAEAGTLLEEVFRREGIEVRVGAAIAGVAHDGSRFAVDLGDADALEAERLLVSAGRRADLGALGVGSVGLDETARFLRADPLMRVREGIWAVGDVTGEGAFTHVAMYQARIAVADILGEEVTPADYHALPRVTFTDPEIGSVGISEQGARDQGLRVRTGSASVPATSRGWIHHAGNDGFIKLIEDADRHVLVGATSAGPVGGEVLGHLVLAVHAGVPTGRLREMIYAFPTFHRGIADALSDLLG